MKIRTISYGLTRNLGNYESAKLSIEVQLEDWENYQETFRLLKVMVADQIGIKTDDFSSITDQDLKLSGELQQLLTTVRSKRSEVEALKREALKLAQETQRLINFKELVYSLKAQMETITKGAEDFYGCMGSTARNLDEMEVIWSGLIPPGEGVEEVDSVQKRLPPCNETPVTQEEEKEELDPIPFDDGDSIDNLVPTDEF